MGKRLFASQADAMHYALKRWLLAGLGPVEDSIALKIRLT